MARRSVRGSVSGLAEVSASVRLDLLIDSAADLSRTGPPEALQEVLREADRLIAREGERLTSDPDAAARLRSVQARILAASESLETEQRRIARDLAALQSMAQSQARYAPPRPISGALDRRG
jgi:hypothetical protein